MGGKTYLRDHLLTADGGWCLPASKVATFSIMDGKGNLREKEDPPRTRWPVARSDLRPWMRLVGSMVRDMPTYHGGRRAA